MSAQKVAVTSEIPEGSGKVVAVGGKTLAIFNCNGVFYATDNTCPHRGGPLGEGDVAGTHVTCPWHGWEFDVANGRCLTNPAALFSAYPLEIKDQEIWISIPANT